MIHFVLGLFWFLVSAVWESRSQILFPPSSGMLMFDKHIKRAISTQAISLILQWLSCAPLMLQNSDDDGSTWLLRAWFPWWRDGDEPWEGSVHCIPLPPSSSSVSERKKRMISGGPQEASIGDCFSNCCKCGILISQDKSKLERRAVYWSTRNVDSLVKWKKNGLYFTHYCLSSRWEHSTW